MDNFITIFVGLSAIAGTVLAILAAYSSNRDEKSEQEIKSIILDISNYCDEILNYSSDYAKYKETRIKVITCLESYRFAYERIEKKLENNNRTYLYCINITQILVILIGLSLIFSVANIFDTKNLSIILLVILPSIFIIPVILLLFNQGLKGLVNHFIPKVENIIYPKPEDLLSPNKDIHITKMVFPELLPLRIFYSCHLLHVYDVYSKDIPEKLMDYMTSLDKATYKTIISMHFKPKFNFSGKLVLRVLDQNIPIEYTIENIDKYILDYENGEYIILMPCKISIDSLHYTFMLELPTKDNLLKYDKIYYSYSKQNNNLLIPNIWFLLDSKLDKKKIANPKLAEFVLPIEQVDV